MKNTSMKNTLNRVFVLSGVLVFLVIVLASTVLITGRSNVGVTSNKAAVSTPPNSNYIYYLPLVAKNNTNFASFNPYAENPNGNTVANATVYSYDGSTLQMYQSSFTCGSLNSTNNPPFPRCAIPIAFPDNESHTGYAVIYSDNELNILTPVAPNFGLKGTAYEAVRVPNNLLTIPVALNSFNGFSTSYLAVSNVSDSSCINTTCSNNTTVTINVYSDKGSLMGSKDITLANHQQSFIAYPDFQTMFGLPSNFTGSISISSGSGQKLIAQTASGNGTTGQYAILNASASPLTSQYFPVYYSNYNNFQSYKIINNPTNYSLNVRVDNYSSSGNSDGSINLTVAPHATSYLTDHLSISPQNTPGTTYPVDNSYGYSLVTSSGEGVVVSENIFNGNQIYETVNGVATAGTNLGMTIVDNGAYNFKTGIDIMNPNGTAVNGNIYYYNPDGSWIGVGSSITLAAHAATEIYLPATTVAGGFDGSARITLDPGQTVLVSTNNIQTRTDGTISGAYMYANPNPTYTALTQYSQTPVPTTNPLPSTLPVTTTPVPTTPLPTTSPIATSTAIQTTNPLPTTLVITSTVSCMCGANNMCTSSCIFADRYPNQRIDPATISCSRESAILPAPSQTDKDSYCNRQKRTIGDANGDGVVDNTDYFYYVRAVNGGAVTTVVDADIDGDGLVSPSDRLIIVNQINIQAKP